MNVAELLFNTFRNCAAWQFIVCAHKFSLAEGNFEEKWPFVQANYRLIRSEISCELSLKNYGNKERNLRISLALLLHNTVQLTFDLTFPRDFQPFACRSTEILVFTHDQKCPLLPLALIMSVPLNTTHAILR